MSNEKISWISVDIEPPDNPHDSHLLRDERGDYFVGYYWKLKSFPPDRPFVKNWGAMWNDRVDTVFTHWCVIEFNQ